MKLYMIIQDDVFGRGLYAARDLARGTIVEMAELLVLSESDTVKVNQTDLQYYTFKYNDKQDCLVMGNGEIFNHSDKPNVMYTLTDILDAQGCFLRRIMVFEVTDDVKAGDQLFIDYNADTEVKTENYNVNLI